MRWIDRGWVLALALLLGMLLDLGTPPLFDRDEGAFSEATREMLASGDFVSPTLNLEPRYDKPILIYWLQATAVKVLGVDEWGFRLPSALAVMVWTLSVVAFASPRLGGRAARAAGLILATSLGTMLIGRAAIADAVLNLWIVLAMFDLWRWHESGRPAPKLRVYLWIGLGALTKGPVAIVVPVGAAFFFHLSRRDLRPWLRAVFDLRGWVVFFAVAAPWYWMQFQREGSAFWEGFFLRHNVERFSGPLEGHGGSLVYYVPVILVLALPFTGLLVPTLRAFRASWRDERTRWLWCWFLFVLVFFTLSGTKLPHYVLLGFTPLALLLGQRIDGLRSRWLAVGPPALLWALLVALPHLVDPIRARLDDPYFEGLLARSDTVFGPVYVVGTALVLVAILVLGALPQRRRAESLVVVALLQAGALAHVVVPTFGDLLQGPVKEAALFARELDRPTVRTGVDLPSISVYRQQPTPRRRPRPGEVSVTTRSERVKMSGVRVLWERGPLLVVEVPDPGPASGAVAPREP